MSYSVFTVVPSENYSVIYSQPNSSIDESSEKVQDYSHYSRQWNDELTIFVMLRYRKWQLQERKTVPLNQFLKQCSQMLLEKFHLYKTPTQIRDKVNNTKSSFTTFLKKGNGVWTPEKASSLSREVFEFMKTYYSGDKTLISIEYIDEYIQRLISKYAQHFTVSSHLKSAILKMKLASHC